MHGLPLLLRKLLYSGISGIMKRFFPLLLVAVCAAALGGCAASRSVHGNFVDDEDVAQIRAGESTRSDVLRLFGSPTTVAPFDSNVWYYAGQKAEKHGIFDPKVTDSRVLAVVFNPDGTVKSIGGSKDSLNDVPLVGRKTPTYGTESTPIQEFFGNLGKFNPQEKPKGR